MQDIIIVAVILVIVLLAGGYIYKAKKSGKKCIGCPDSGSCSSHSCGCGSEEPAEEETKACCCGCQSDETE